MSGLDDERAMRKFVDTVMDAYRVLMGLGEGDEVVYELARGERTSILQVTVMGMEDAVIGDADGEEPE